MKVLVKNIRHINESIFQNMFDQSFHKYNKIKILESVAIPTGGDLTGWSYNPRTNIANYLNEGIFIGSAINQNSKKIPSPIKGGPRLTYPYVPISGYGITPLEYKVGVSSTGLRRSGIGEDDDIMAEFEKASNNNPGAFVQPEDIILGWQQNIDNTDIEHKNTGVAAIDRKQTWDDVGNAIAFLQICRLSENGELIFDGNLKEPYEIYGTQQQAGSNIQYVKLEPLTRETFKQFMGGQTENVINAKLSHVVTEIKKQFGIFSNTKNSESLKFLIYDPDSVEPNKGKDGYKNIPAKVYQKVFTYIVQYFYIKANDKDTKDKIIKEYDYIKKGDDYSVKGVYNFIIAHQNEDVVQHMRKPSLNDLKPYKEVVFDTEDEKNELNDKLIEYFNENKSSLTKTIINNIIKSIGVKKEGASVAKRDDGSVVIKYDKVNTIVECILSINKDMKGLYSYIKEQYGKKDNLSVINDIYFEKNKKYYYWKNIGESEITEAKNRLKVLDAIIKYNNAIGDSGAHKDDAILKGKGAGGFRDISGEGIGQKFMNACIYTYNTQAKKSFTFTIHRNTSMSMNGDKVTSLEGDYRAFILFNTNAEHEYDYSDMFKDLTKKFNEENDLIPNLSELPTVLKAKRLTGMIFFLPINEDVENNIKKKVPKGSGKDPYKGQRADHSVIYSVDKNAIGHLPKNQKIEFNVLLVKNNDNYFFMRNYESDYFKNKSGKKIDVVIKHKGQLDFVAGSDRNQNKSASKMIYGNLNEADIMSGIRDTKEPFYDIALKSNIDLVVTNDETQKKNVNTVEEIDINDEDNNSSDD